LLPKLISAGLLGLSSDLFKSLLGIDLLALEVRRSFKL